MKKLILIFLSLLVILLIIQFSIKHNNVQIEQLFNTYDNLIKVRLDNINVKNEQYQKQIEDLQNQLIKQNEEFLKQKQDIEKIKKEFSLIKEVSKRTGLPLKAASSLIKGSKSKGIRASFVMGLYNYESEFNWKCVNPSSNATGLGQFLPSTAKWIAQINGIDYSYSKLKDPVYNINLTYMYLEYLFNKYDGNEIMVLKEYGDQTRSYPYIVISRGNVYRDLDTRIKNTYK